MKLPTLLLAGSLLANAALLTAFAFRVCAPPDPSSPLPGAGASAPSGAQPLASPQPGEGGSALHSQPYPWSTLATDDLRPLITHLRAAGFPPAVVRSVIDAQLAERFAARLLAQSAATTLPPYWKPDPTSYTPFGGNKLWENHAELFRARTQEARELFSDDWLAQASDGAATSEQTRRYGPLSRAKIDRIERINADYDEMSAQLQAAAQGVNLLEDREKFLLLRQERRADLAAALSPEEFADYELRNSSTARGKRTTLTLMNATEDEFRTVHRLQQALENRLASDLASTATPAAYKQLENSLQEQLARDLRAALGDARFADYQRANTFDFQRLSAAAERERLSTETTLRAYALRDTLAQESNRIATSSYQNADQKREALRVLAQNTRAQLLALLGPTAHRDYLPFADRWIAPVETGQSLAFHPDGTPRFQPLPAPAP